MTQRLTLYSICRSVSYISLILPYILKVSVIDLNYFDTLNNDAAGGIHTPWALAVVFIIVNT